MMVVPVQISGSTFVAGTPTKLFATAYLEPNPARHYDVSPDSRRFLMIKDTTGAGASGTMPSLVVVTGWLDELQSRVPRK